MMPRPGTQALAVSRADEIYISALFASSVLRNNILLGRWDSSIPHSRVQSNIVWSQTPIMKCLVY